MGRKGHPLAARIKKIMQTDEDVGKISHATPIMIARALELFLQRLCTKSSEVATARKAKTLTCSHVKAYVNSDELMDFITDTVAGAPDLPPEGEPEQPKAKRQRTSEPKPRAPRGEGRGSKAKRESADGAAAAAAAAGGGSDAGDPPAQAAAVDAEHVAAAPAAAAAAVLPAVQAVKQERSSSSPTAAQAAKGGFGGLGAHPFLAARTFGKAGGFRKSGSSLSPKPESPLKQQQQKPAAAAAGVAAMAPAQQQQQQVEPQQQLGEEQEQSAYAQVAPSLLPGLSAKLLAGFAAPQHHQAAEDDYDDDYDS